MRGSRNRVPMMTGLILVLLGGMAAGRVWGACEVPTEWIATRPDPEGEPTEVKVGVYLIDLQAINDSEQLFLADIFFSVTWKDPRLVADTGLAPLVGCRIGLDGVWNPRLVFVNERSVKRLFEKEVTVGADGTVEYVQRLQGEFTTPLRLRDFPFDRHELSLEIVARGYFPEQWLFFRRQEGGRWPS